MNSREERQERVAQVARKVTSVIRRQARRRWEGVRTAQRNAAGCHVWRFRAGADGAERFLHIPHEAMSGAEGAAEGLLRQLRSSRWLDRMDATPDASLRLSREGQLEPFRA